MAGKSDADKIIEILHSDEIPTTEDMMRLNVIVYDHYPVAEVIERMGKETMLERLVFKVKLWVTDALEKLRTHAEGTPEYKFRSIATFREQFPDSIGPIITDAELAVTRRNAHIRAGRLAAEHLRADRPRHAQTDRTALGHALLAGVSRKILMSPPSEMCDEALEEVLPRKKIGGTWADDFNRARASVIKAFREINRPLNQLLRAPREAKS